MDLFILAMLGAGGALADRAQPVRPDGSPQSWITDDDYPAEAARRGESGITGVRLNIDAAGRVVGCTITGPSGSELLDRRACELLSERARFVPARDARGRAIASTFATRFRWNLPALAVIPAEPFAMTVSLTINPDGGIVGCRTERRGTDPYPTTEPCNEIPYSAAELAGMHGGGYGPSTIMIEQIVDIDGKPRLPRRSEGAGFRGIGALSLRFEISDTGNVGGCVVALRTGAGTLRSNRDTCFLPFKYPPLLPSEAGMVRRGTFSWLFATSGRSLIVPDDNAVPAARLIPPPGVRPNPPETARAAPSRDPDAAAPTPGEGEVLQKAITPGDGGQPPPGGPDTSPDRPPPVALTPTNA